MAQSSSFTEYKKILADVRAGKFAPVYLLMGEEGYFIDALTDALAESVVPEDQRDFNQILVYGQDVNVDSLANALRQFPMMAERQLVIVKELQSLRDWKSALDKLAPYIAQPTPTTVFVVAGKVEKYKPSAALTKALKKGGGVFFASSELWENQIDDVVNDYCNSVQVKLADKSMLMLKEFIGIKLTNIKSAIDKIAMAEAERPLLITPEMVEKHIGISKEYNSTELVAAVARHDYARVMRMCDYFERNPKGSPAVMRTAALFGFFQGLMMCHYAKDKSPRGLTAVLGARSEYAHLVKNTMAAMPYYSAVKCVDIIRYLRDFDCQSKGVGSLQGETPLFYDLMFKIMTR